MDPILGMIQAFAFNYAPANWLPCDGRLLPISGNETLFSILGATFGGDGYTNFGLPDLRGRTIVGVGSATQYTSAIQWGQKGGSESVMLSQANLPAHMHTLVNGDGTEATVNVTTKIQTVNNDLESNESDNGANGLGTGGNMESIYRESPSGTDSIGGVSSTISGSTTAWGAIRPVALPVRNPYIGLIYCICTVGEYPQRPN